MKKWFNVICLIFWIVTTILAAMTGIEIKEAFVTYGMMSVAIWLAGWATFFAMKFLIKTFPRKFHLTLIRVIAIVIISMTAYSMAMQVLSWLLGIPV